jgi:UDP-3-O-[3-hydroxymyristoyl] glucosamine N-acyltransferase
MTKISSKEIADFFGYSYSGDPFAFITHAAVVEDQSDDSLLWAKNENTLSKIKKGTVVIPPELSASLTPGVNFIITDPNSRLCFSKILNQFLAKESNDFDNQVAEFKKRKDIRIGDGCFIGSNVTIGEGTVIFPSVVILSNTKIGKNCVIQSNCTISTSGLGYERLSDGSLVKFPQLGCVIIHDNVEIGPNTTIRKAALGNTIVNKGVVIGGLCNIGHNSVIGENSLLITQCVIGGSSVIGKNSYVGINAIIKNKISVGDNCQIAMGAVVVKDVPDGKTYVGNPAIDIDDYKLWSKVKKHLMRTFGKDVQE